jgi:membrane-associated protein
MEFFDGIFGLVRGLFDFILHIDEHLDSIIRQYGTWTYAILFAIIFVETGLVIMPLLPGDSLLFAAGAFAARGSLNPILLFVLLSIAAILGDSINYSIGRYFGPRAFTMNSRFFKKEYLDKAHAFYEKYGGRAIIFARFVPIVRTFAPFVAGAAYMTYSKFLLFNITGGVVWIALFVSAGYFFGNIPAVEKHFEIVIFAIIGISLLPMVYEYVQAKRRSRRAQS